MVLKGLNDVTEKTKKNVTVFPVNPFQVKMSNHDNTKLIYTLIFGL